MDDSGRHDPDVVVIGAGPNGLTAAAWLARAGLRVLVLEANDAVGGAVRTAEVTLPGFRHDPFSAFYPLTVVGPIGRLPLERHGLTWCSWARPYGGATAGGTGVAQQLDLAGSVASFERSHRGDGDGWRELYRWWQWGGDAFLSLLFHPVGDVAPLLRGAPLLRSPRRLAEFAQLLSGSARAMGERFFGGEDARIWLIGSVAHSDLVPEDAVGGGFGLLLAGLSQQVGMPIPRGGAQAIPDALAALVTGLGGEIRTGQPVVQVVVRHGRAVAVRTPAGEHRARRAVLATVQPQSLFLDLVGAGHLPADFVRLVERFRWGSGVFQMSCALSGLPRFRAEALNDTLVVHLARSVNEASRAMAAARQGTLPAHPLLIAGIHTLADPSRAPAGKHTFWLMTHVPSRIEGDGAGTIAARTWAEAKGAFVERVLDELEFFAPGFRQLVLGVHAQTPLDLEAANANLVGGDIGSGSYALDQQLVFRPLPGWFRYRTPIDGLYISGAATHPGGGVHGAAGTNAAGVLLYDQKLGTLPRALGSGAGRLAGAVQRLGRALVH